MRRIVALVVAATALTATAIGVASAPAGATTPPHTAQIVVRPVHANGTAVHGYHVVNETSDVVSCYGQSQVAVSGGIDICSPDATYAVACWKSTGHTVLCLRDPRSKQLYRLSYSGSFPSARPARHVSPMALVLDSRVECTVRDGGAWGTVTTHPTWVGWYWCGNDSAVYGPPTGDGINRTKPLWSVYTVVWSPQKVTRHTVSSAYYVGTAA